MKHDVLVIGAGISGLAFAFAAARAGRQVTVLEASDRIGGCLHSVRTQGHWYELGGHTVYNSYGGFIEIAEGTGALDHLVQRGDARKTFGLLRDGEVTWLTPPRMLLQFWWPELLWNAPFGWLKGKAGRTMAEYYGGLIGPGNFGRVLSPFLAAVPSQSADDFPADGPGSLFKKRPRREDVVRSFGFEGGLQAVCDGVANMDGVTVQTGVRVGSLAEVDADIVAVATPVSVAADLVRPRSTALADVLDTVETVQVDSVGVTLPECWIPPCAFVVPIDDVFFSAVTRDPFPDSDGRRAFAFHFRPGLSRDDRLKRIAEVLQVSVQALGVPIEASRVLPAPRLGHDERVAAIDSALDGTPGLSVVGNYFDGLAIEDCVQRGFSEWARVS